MMDKVREPLPSRQPRIEYVSASILAGTNAARAETQGFQQSPAMGPSIAPCGPGHEPLPPAQRAEATPPGFASALPVQERPG